jgi:dTDP-4-dehydrorhamnose reductase
MPDLVNFILKVLLQLNNKEVEVFHFSNEVFCSWHNFAKAIFEIKGISVKVNPTEIFQYPTPAKKPYYSVLNKSKINKKYKIIIPYWKKSLTNCLKRL